ncbi:pentapeptide repeat-containing protein [Streptomyces sp. NRRL S-237]|uniref:pentapeptide repeat-containing protein n=1 Tax=Streptomyces sp. NRRL S-237 TaxID=1463895 RepID=UPI000ADAF487|nr:pentapeptide repeat-containing protein [Streptomyces sp. NRRL S-237]
MDPYAECLAHLSDSHCATYLASLGPGSDLDHRGASLTEDLLSRLLDAVRDPVTQRPLLGVARFDAARFLGDADFDGSHFSNEAGFEQAVFLGLARFAATKFGGDSQFERARFCGAQFREARFDGDAWFGEARFADEVRFDRTRFSGHARFGLVSFMGNTAFDGAQFLGNVGFQGATFGGHAWFDGARFERDARLGPLVCAGSLDLSAVVFAAPVVIEAAARRVWCTRTRWEATAVLRLRYATIDLSESVLAHPLTITAQAAPFNDRTGTGRTEAALDESDLGEHDAQVRMASLRGVDAAHLALHNVDLTRCLLSGAIHLDQLRLEGECPLALPPAGIRRRGRIPMRWTKRRTLAEEQHWRAAQGCDAWTAAPAGVKVLEPPALAALYRQLRKSFEDRKNEPDAADFYYGEMEMRRHDLKRPGAERTLLTLYWAVSGYGLRASRALAWLLGAMAATMLVVMLWGLPKEDARPGPTNSATNLGISRANSTADPINPDGPLAQRMTSERFEKSARVVINSVVFRSSTQSLTTSGTYAEMLSRLVEPALLGLAALAVRGRVKR